MKLTDNFCKNIKPLDRLKKYTDGAGLYLEVNIKGQKYWRLKYRFNQKEKRLSIGVYPTISLKEARLKRDEAKSLLTQNIDPSTNKKEQKSISITNEGDLLKNITLEWYNNRKDSWSPKHAKTVWNRIEKDIIPEIGNISIKDIKTTHLIDLLKKIESRGAIDIAKRIRQICSQIFQYAIAMEKVNYDPTTGLKGILKPTKTKHFNHLKEDDLPEFFSKLEEYNLHPLTKLAIKFTIHTFVRTNEVRHSKWSEFNMDKKEWHIPAERMKMREKHIVPLTDTVINLIEEIKKYNHNSEYLFPNANNLRKPMSENTMLYGLYRLGYHSRATIHGFRATASTILNENGFRSDIIERQLAHAERNSIRASYNHAEYLVERKDMMTWWSDFVLKQENKSEK